MQRTPLERLATIASVVFIADFASKRWALAHLADGAAAGGSSWRGVHFALVNNTRLAWGLETGGFELQVTALATLAVALIVARIYKQLTDVDAGAPQMLGLLVGAGAANLADALVPPHGVVDFIGFTAANGATTSFNVADLAVAGGLALCARTAWRLVQIMRGRRERPRRRSFATSGVTPMRHRLLVSGGHALLAMCAFVWVYSMAVAFTPNAGSAAPSALTLGVVIFAVVFAVSQAHLWSAARRTVDARVRPPLARTVERVVLEGSLAGGRVSADEPGAARDRPAARRERPLPYAPRPSVPDAQRDGDRA